MFHAPNPTDVCWENLHFSDDEKLKRNRLACIYFVLIIIVAFGIIWSLYYIEKEMIDNYLEEIG